MRCLEAQIGNEKPVIAALDQQLSVVSARVSWRQHAPGGLLRGSFNVQGSSEEVRLDWRSSSQLARDAMFTVRVIDADSGAPPTRAHKQKIDWKQFFRERRKRDIARILELKAALGRVRRGLTPEQLYRVKAPLLAVIVMLNGRQIERSVLWGPGVVSAGVILWWKSGGVHAQLEMSAMERRSKNGWQCWPHRRRSLSVNDVVSFGTVAVKDTERRRRGGHLDGIESEEEVLVTEIARLRHRTATNTWYKAQARAMEKVS